MTPDFFAYFEKLDAQIKTIITICELLGKDMGILLKLAAIPFIALALTTVCMILLIIVGTPFTLFIRYLEGLGDRHNKDIVVQAQLIEEAPSAVIQLLPRTLSGGGESSKRWGNDSQGQ